MGDCRMRIVIAKDLLSKERLDVIFALISDQKDVTVSEAKYSICWTRMFTSDSTIREVAEWIPDLWSLLSSSSFKMDYFHLWDCTTHPPKDISNWPTEIFSELTGPKSKTLHDAGYFPSGTWMVLPKGISPSQFNNTEYDDIQYNRQESVGALFGKVEFTNPIIGSDSSKPLPSQVMASVTRRFEHEDTIIQAQVDQAQTIRLENRIQRQKRQQERFTKLDQRILLLESQSSEKNKNVSDQVRRMLVKSRATGEKRLKLHDRLYFECILDKNKDPALVREFRFFSPQDTFATISSSFDGPKSETMNVEVLTKHRVGEKEEYRRFPVAMRLYEAIAANFLSGDDVDTLIIRWYEGDNTDATPSILDKELSLDNDADIVHEDVQDIEIVNACDCAVLENPLVLQRQTIADKSVAIAIADMDEVNCKGKKPKKASAAATKVRNMQIKSKAIGDAKRIPKVEDRFFLEVVEINGNVRKATSCFRFLAAKDPIERLIKDVYGSTTTSNWEFLVPVEGENMTYEKIMDISMTFADASEKGILKSFDRLILRPI